jgi:succinoglycan biosynthesis transport protein ExoP
MDGIQPYAGGSRPVVATVHPPGASPSSVKVASDYLRAIRRRIWLALAVAIPIATAGTLFVLRLPPVYMVSASIEIKPPRVDPAVAQLINGEMGRGDSTDEKYIPDTLALLKSKSLTEEVVRDPGLGLPASALEGDPALELMAKVAYRQIPQSHFYTVTLEGRDPDRITRTLNVLLDKFQKRADSESRDASEQARSQASTSVTTYERQLNTIEKDLTDHIKNSMSLSPGGKNLTEAHYDALSQRLFYQQQNATNLQRQAQLETLRPAPVVPGNPDKARMISELLAAKKNQNLRLKKARRISREESDPAIMHALAELKEIDADLARLQGGDEPPEAVSAAQVYDQILSGAVEEIRTTEGQLTNALTEMKDAMPAYHKYTTLMGERERRSKQLADLKEKISVFNMLAATQKSPVRIIDSATDPTVPKSPNRVAYIAFCIVSSLALGLGLVCLLEHIDHSVKVPEHLTLGLSLPLFGVVPRMLRNARNHRGGHLWTPGAPDSIEADAYRNLRASLLGANDSKRPIITLLVTSAKAGEGKSTTALNLAATCARAGERTLLMDVDLRRPSLDEVFPRPGEGTGLVDILRGDLPWQRTVVQTDLPNLDFLPTGDTRDVPIEVLGSLELRQLLVSLSEHHYDRVILDGPAVLGLADCRMLGRIVDAAVMVVRSGSQELRSLQRAKAMLEQSQVHIAGLVFNGLSEDLDNWSSYGPNPLLDASVDLGGSRPAGSPRGLDATHSGAPALMAAGPVEA